MQTFRVRIKICGITNADDALLAAALGADALGFIFYAQSPRCVTPAAARAIIELLPPFVTPVAVVVGEPADAVQALMARTGCRVVQYHGENPGELHCPIIKAHSVSSLADLDALYGHPYARAFLLDTKIAGQYGGTGQPFDWTIARQAKEYGKPIILAGGLSPENVGEAIRIAAPHAVDINSGIERAPGRKDPERMRAVFAAVEETTAP